MRLPGLEQKCAKKSKKMLCKKMHIFLKKMCKNEPNLRETAQKIKKMRKLYKNMQKKIAPNL